MKILFFFILFFSIRLLAVSGSYSLEWEHSRSTASEETTFSHDFSKSLSLDWDFSLSRSLVSSLAIDLYRCNSYSSDNFSISPVYKIRERNISTSFNLTKYSYIDSPDYIEQDISLEYSKPIKDNSITFHFNQDGYNYIDESSGYNDYFITDLSVDYYIPLSEDTYQYVTYSYERQNTHFDDTQDYDLSSIEYDYTTNILNFIDFAGTFSYIDQTEKSEFNSDFKEYFHDFDISHSWKDYTLSIKDSDTYHHNEISQLYDSSYVLSESEINYSGSPSELISFSIDALSSNEKHREFPEENTESFDLSLSITFNINKWEISFSNSLSTYKYTVKDDENTNQNQKSITNDISTSYSLSENTSIDFNISYDKTKYEWDPKSNDINTSFEFSRDF